MALSSVERFIKVTETDHDFNSFVELTIACQEVDGLFENFWIISVANTA